MTPTTTSTFSPKTFFQRKEGKLGLALPIVGGFVLIYFMGSSIIDYILGALANTIELGIFAGIIIGAFMFRKPLWYMYKSLCRFITGQFIEIDPIGVLKNYKGRLQGKLEDMRKSIDLLNGQKIKVERIINNNNSQIDHSMGLVEQAVKVGDTRI